MTDRLLISMLRAGAKASKIARLCRAEKTLFSILIQEKGKLQNEKMDFKTLADVFIQQVVKTEISSMCPEINDRVYGEENNQFTNKLGETITVEMKNTKLETTELLTAILDGNEEAAMLFSEAAHSDENSIDINEATLSKLSQCEVDLNKLGIWIDPIDATSQYVNGLEDAAATKNVHAVGLQCVTVLIGAYDIMTGLPVIGVIFQPFFKKLSSGWDLAYYWGVSFGDFQINNLDSKLGIARMRDELPLVVVSPSDHVTRDVIAAQSSVEMCSASGAGYKCLCVVNGSVDAYLYSGNACYTWDTCAAHALLLSMGGGICKLSDVSTGTTARPQLLYNKPNPPGKARWAHVGGFAAYSNSSESEKCLSLVGYLQQ